MSSPDNPFIIDDVVSSQVQTQVIRRKKVGNPVINWTFTLNNYEQEDFEFLDTLFSQAHFKYLINGKEICPTSGTPRSKGFLQLKKKQRFTGVKKLLGSKYHIEEAIYPELAKDYCKKDGEFNEFGHFSTAVTLLYE